eukprot:3044804-Ditylum_brightwellii.AAC.1
MGFEVGTFSEQKVEGDSVRIKDDNNNSSDERVLFEENEEGIMIHGTWQQGENEEDILRVRKEDKDAVPVAKKTKVVLKKKIKCPYPKYLSCRNTYTSIQHF